MGWQAHIVDSSLKDGLGILLPTLSKILDRECVWYTGSSGQEGSMEHFEMVFAEITKLKTLDCLVARLQVSNAIPDVTRLSNFNLLAEIFLSRNVSWNKFREC